MLITLNQIELRAWRKFKTMDTVSGQIIFEELNQCNVVFHSIDWDSSNQDVPCL